MKTIRLITCDDAVQAHIYQGALENEGIESILHNENCSTVLKGCLSNISGVDIFVFEDDYERAIRVLRKNQSFPDELKYCPFCGSGEIKLKLRKGGRLRAVFAAIGGLLTMTPPGSNHWMYVCKHCKASFEKPVSVDYKKEEDSQL